MYFIDVIVNDPQRVQVADGNTSLRNVSPGHAARWKVTTTARYSAGVTCQLSMVLQGPAP
jgi:hypothetical protein